MEPFSKSSSESAGMAALNTLFGSTPSQGAGTPAEQPSSSLTELPPDSTGEATPEAELGSHGKLGETTDSTLAKDAPEGAPGTAEPSWFEFAVTDDKGRRKVKVDLNNKEQLARVLPQAYGFRKMQAERDVSRQKLEAAEPRLKELESNWQTLEKTYQEGGVEGIIDLLGGKKGHFSEWKKAEFAKETKYASASEIERQKMELEDRLARMERQGELREKNAKAEAERARGEREEAQLRSLESQITPAFNKHRFAGQLGDTSKEQVIDQAIWDQALKNLEALPETTDLTPALIEKEFRSIATTFKSVIGKQADAKVKQVIQGKKTAAQTQVAAAVTRSIRPSQIEQSMQSNIRKGGISGLTAGLLDVLRSR